MRPLALLLIVVVACSSTTIVVERRRTIIRVDVQRCLSDAPPDPPALAGDPKLDEARQLDAYDPLARWVYLYAWPSCREP